MCPTFHNFSIPQSIEYYMVLYCYVLYCRYNNKCIILYCKIVTNVLYFYRYTYHVSKLWWNRIRWHKAVNLFQFVQYSLHHIKWGRIRGSLTPLGLLPPLPSFSLSKCALVDCLWGRRELGQIYINWRKNCAV